MSDMKLHSNYYPQTRQNQVIGDCGLSIRIKCMADILQVQLLAKNASKSVSFITFSREVG